MKHLQIAKDDADSLMAYVRNLETENTAAHARYDEVMAENRRLNGELEELETKLRNVRLWIESVRGIGVGAIDLQRLRVIASDDDWQQAASVEVTE